MQTITARLWDAERNQYTEQPVVTEDGINWSNFVDSLVCRKAVDGRGRVLGYLVKEGVLTLPKKGSYFFIDNHGISQRIRGRYDFTRKDDAETYFNQVRLKEANANIREKSLQGIAMMVTDIINR